MLSQAARQIMKADGFDARKSDAHVGLVPSRLLVLSHGIDGGIAPLASRLAQGIDKAGWDCRVVYIGRPAVARRLEQDAESGVKSQIIHTGRARSFAEAWGLLRSVRKVRRILRQHRPDCVIFAGFIPALVYPFFLRPLTKARFIFWDHAPQNSFTHVKKALFPLSLRHIDRIVSISGSTASALTRLFGIRPERIAIVHNGIEPSRWRRLPAVKNFETLRIVMPARFDLNQKDPLTLIRAAALLHQEGIPVEVTLVGSGEGEAIMRHAIAEAKADSYITLLGHTDDVPALVARHNILCLSTHFEGLATVLLEGMLAGRLVIASAVPGCVDIVKDGYNGLLFKPGDAEDCARALKSAQTRSDVAVMIERGCKQVLEEFTPAAMVDGFLKVMIS